MERSQDIRSRARETRIAAIDRERGQQQSDPHHVALAGGHGDQHDGHPGDEEQPAADGQQAPWTRHRYLRSGMCTELTAWAITSVTERRASWASVEGSTRWASTETPRAAMSSGLT